MHPTVCDLAFMASNKAPKIVLKQAVLSNAMPTPNRSKFQRIHGEKAARLLGLILGVLTKASTHYISYLIDTILH
jgi:hypothetical protein